MLKSAPAPSPATPSPAPAPSAPPPSRAPQLILAFDFGKRRIGVACGDSVGRSPRPLPSIVSTPARPPWAVVDALVRDWQPAVIVVGLPYHLDGSESAMSGAARSFAAELAQRHGVPVRLIDERYSSLEAQSRLKSARASGLRRRRVAKADIDAAAACVILERWFRESSRG